MQLHDVINEINNLKDDPSHRSALEICNFLTRNKHRFASVMDADNLSTLIDKFTMLSERKPMEARTDEFRDEFQKACSLLSYYLDRIL